jgi:hypothetical protein
MACSHCGSENADDDSCPDVHTRRSIDRCSLMHARSSFYTERGVDFEVALMMMEPCHHHHPHATATKHARSCFRFAVCTAHPEHARIYEDTCKWLLRVVQTKLAMADGARWFDEATLVTTVPGPYCDGDVDIEIAMSRASYIEHLGAAMSASDVDDELDATMDEVTWRCYLALRRLHAHIERVRLPATHDARIQVRWMDDG